jgi:hypothetical protein
MMLGLEFALCVGAGPVDCAERGQSNRLSRFDDFGRLGHAYCETDEERIDLECVISDLLTGQYTNPVRMVAFNIAEH